MEVKEIFTWWNRFYDEVIEGKKPVRGRCFSGGRIELWGNDDIVIVLHDPYLRGTSEESKAKDFVNNIFDKDQQSISAQMNLERFERIVRGEESLEDRDWTWPDE